MTDLHTQPGPERAAAMDAALKVAGDLPRPILRTMVCPYCGSLTPDAASCSSCKAKLDPLSRQATQNQMGPWFVRDEDSSFRPGCSYSTMTKLIGSGAIKGGSVVRGPSTRQFWMLAKHTPGLAHLLGSCHNCGEPATPDMFACRACGEPFSVDRDRQHMGIGPVRALPGTAPAEVLALHAEPAGGADRVQGPAIRVVAEQGPRRQGPKGDEGAEALRQIEELSRSVSVLRKAWLNERNRAWVSVACAGAVTVLAALILVLSTMA